MDAIALIPAYEPGDGLVGYVDQLVQRGFGRIVVVDDGSGERFRAVFDLIEAKPFCTVLRHDSNRGKGAAIKTGLSFILREFPDAVGVVTADSDGQHAPEDCRRLAEMLIRPDITQTLKHSNTVPWQPHVLPEGGAVPFLDREPLVFCDFRPDPWPLAAGHADRAQGVPAFAVAVHAERERRAVRVRDGCVDRRRPEGTSD